MVIDVQTGEVIVNEHWDYAPTAHDDARVVMQGNKEVVQLIGKILLEESNHAGRLREALSHSEANKDVVSGIDYGDYGPSHGDASPDGPI
jgi:hypothetical protein